ncbi:hypothetical protein BH11MYX3_BH11MYX3_03860 [soil metagenome]
MLVAVGPADNGIVRWLLVLLTACGRIGIDPLAPVDATPVPVDTAPVLCAVEGTPCDDQNICSPTSSCTSGVCVATSGDPTCTAGDSREEFGSIQGEHNWYYGYWNRTEDADSTYEAADFTEMTVFPGGLWRPPDYADTGPTFSWAYHAGFGGHPGSYPLEKLPIRRWSGPLSGHAEAVVTWKKSDTSNGDGTRAILVVDGVRLWERSVAFDDGVGFVEAVPIELHPGSTVDLLLDYIGDDGGDTTEYWMTIRSR